jgi:hypothetical protein
VSFFHIARSDSTWGEGNRYGCGRADLGHIQTSVLNDYKNSNGQMHQHKLVGIKRQGHINPQTMYFFDSFFNYKKNSYEIFSSNTEYTKPKVAKFSELFYLITF